MEVTITKNFSGIPIKSSLDNATSVLYAGLIGQLTEKAKNVVREMVNKYSKSIKLIDIRKQAYVVLTEWNLIRKNVFSKIYL